MLSPDRCSVFIWLVFKVPETGCHLSHSHNVLQPVALQRLLDDKPLHLLLPGSRTMLARGNRNCSITHPWCTRIGKALLQCILIFLKYYLFYLPPTFLPVPKMASIMIKKQVQLKMHCCIIEMQWNELYLNNNETRHSSKIHQG